WGRPSRKRWRGILAAPALLVGAVVMGFLLHEIAALISGHPDPSFAHPWALRLALAFGVWSVALFASRLEAGAVAAWLWIAGLGVAVAITLPGFSPYFLFPSLVAALFFLLTLPMGKTMKELAAFLAALACTFTWLNLAATGEAIMGLAAHPIFTLSAGFALVALMPLMRAAKITTALASLALALVLAVIAGFLPPFSAASPARLNLHYVEENGRAVWAADPVVHLPESLRRAGHFAGIARIPLLGRAYVADAGRAQIALPDAAVEREGDRVTVTLHGSMQATGMMLVSSAPFTIDAVGGRPFEGLPHVTRLLCDTPDCARATIALKQKTIGSFEVIEVRRGLPVTGNVLLSARPADAVPSGAGDQTWLVRQIP
ncbi:MAG: hypothetical protein ACREFW_09215, partial [Rhizomicrobium sp.]